MADLEFEVEAKSTDPKVFSTFNEAAGHAFSLSAGGQENVTISVLVWTEKAASEWGGDDAIEQYREDPAASAFERFEVKVTSVGRVA